MEKNELGSIIIYLVMFALIYLVGQTVITISISELGYSSSQAWPYVLICMAISVVLFVLIYELGHIVGAKIGKYKLTYINILSFCFYKQVNKWKFKFEGFEGLFSETRFAPISDDANPAHFLRGGILTFILSIIVAFVLFMVEPILPTIRYGSLIYIGMGLVFILYNVIPMKTDILNDGYRLKLLGKKENAKAYNEFLRIEEQIRHGELPSNIMIYENISPMTVLINKYAYYERLSKKDYQEAEKIVDLILANEKELDTTTIYVYRFQKLFFEIKNKNIEEATKYYWDVLESGDRKILAKDNHISTRRVYLLVSGLINESLSESKIAIEGMKKRIEKIEDKTQREVELKLYEEAIEIVSKKLNTEELIKEF